MATNLYTIRQDADWGPAIKNVFGKEFWYDPEEIRAFAYHLFKLRNYRYLYIMKNSKAQYQLYNLGKEIIVSPMVETPRGAFLKEDAPIYKLRPNGKLTLVKPGAKKRSKSEYGIKGKLKPFGL